MSAIESIIEIGKAYCESDVFGAEHTILINKHKGALSLPNFPLDHKHSESSLGIPLLSPTNSPPVSSYKDVEWGNTSYDAANNGAWLNKVIVRFNFNPADDNVKENVNRISQEVNQKANQWVEDFTDGLEVYSKQDLLYPQSFKVIEPKLNFILIDGSNNNKSIRNGTINVTVPTNDFHSHPISYDILHKSIENTNNGLKPRIEYLLLKNARRELYRGSYRQSVLDSATALEVSITNAAREILQKSLDKKIADDILRKFDGLIKKIELCKILNINIPYSQDELNKSVNAHRIDVVHRGLTPTYKNAKVAIEISTDVVEKITPLV